MLLLFPLGTGQAAEEITAFDAVIEVRPDGMLDISETILVRVEGEQITRGIYRDLPLSGPSGTEGRIPASFEVLSVTRNGRSEPYRVTERGEALRVRIGENSVLLRAPSQQRYEIRYRTLGSVQALDGYDELIWNVTGRDWAFPIRSASVEIRLPDQAEILQSAADIGPQRSPSAGLTEIETAPGLFRARTTASVPRGEGLTVTIAWPSGLVEVPKPRLFMGHPLEDLAAIGSTLLGSGILLLLWLAVGLDPRAKAIYPSDKPPANLGPAAARYVQRQAYDDRCASAAILSMAVKGAIRIEEDRDSTSANWGKLSLLPLGSPGKALTPAEEAAYREMFPGDYALVLRSDRGNGGRMDRAREALRSELKREHLGASFKRNGAYTSVGLAVGLVVALVLFWLSGPAFIGSAIAWGSSAVLGGAVTLVVSTSWRVLKDRAFTLSGFRTRLPFPPGRRSYFALPIALFMIVAFAFLLDGHVRVANLYFTTGEVAIIAGAAYGVVAILFSFLMAAPTKAGRGVMDEIEGFALYLRTTSDGRLGIPNPPKHTPDLFERYLPYAVAFDLSDQWCAKFASIPTAAAGPTWYAGAPSFVPSDLDQKLGEAVVETSEPLSMPDGSFNSGFSSSGSSGSGGRGGGGW